MPSLNCIAYMTGDSRYDNMVSKEASRLDKNETLWRYKLFIILPNGLLCCAKLDKIRKSSFFLRDHALSCRSCTIHS